MLSTYQTRPHRRFGTLIVVLLVSLMGVGLLRIPGVVAAADGFWSDSFDDATKLASSSGVEVDPRSYDYRLRLAVQATSVITPTTADFAAGTFDHTELVGNAIWLAATGTPGQYDTTGVYTSTVYDAGQTVDWGSVDWGYGATTVVQAPHPTDPMLLEFRTGVTPTPDATWSVWLEPGGGEGPSGPCAGMGSAGGSGGSDWGEWCSESSTRFSNSRYIQYRVQLATGNSANSIHFNGVVFRYKTYISTGTATSELIAPSSLTTWGTVVYTATVPLNTSLTVNVLDSDGTVLLRNVASGTSLASLDSLIYPSLRLQANLASNDPASTPRLDAWQVTWDNTPDNLALTLNAGYNNVQLDWIPASNPSVTSYRIARTRDQSMKLAPLTTVTELRYQDRDSTLITGRTYCYRIEALQSNDSVVATSSIACTVFGRLDLWIPPTFGQSGQEVFVPVNIRNANGLRIAAANIWLNFDSTVITPTEVLATPLTAGRYTFQAGTSTPGRVIIAAISTDQPVLYGEGALFWVKFRVIGSTGATSPLDLREFITSVGGSNIFSPDDLINPIPLALEDGTFQVAPTYILGDVNGNGVIGAEDAFLACIRSGGA